jgi:histidyl-tRNA synthetase
MYAFTDKEGVQLALRPEMTPSLARMVLQRQAAQTGQIRDVLPLKWFTVAQCWRHENVQRGRKREHYQWNMDIVGFEGVTAELELLSAVVSFFTDLGITAADVGILVSSRRVLQGICAAFGVPASKFVPVCMVLDKLGKIGAEAVKAQLLVTLGIGTSGIGTSGIDDMGNQNEKNGGKSHGDGMLIDGMLAMLANAKSVDAVLEMLGDRVSDELRDELRDACAEVARLFELATACGLGAFLQFDASLVRGLAYVTSFICIYLFAAFVLALFVRAPLY